MNNTANIKQFQLIKSLNDDNAISKISVILRRDKIEAPYYMITKIKVSSCIDRPDNGLIHAMDVLNHHRMYNLTEDKYNEIESLIINNEYESNQVKISKKDKYLSLVLTSKNNDEVKNLFKMYGELFDKIDSIID